MKNKFGTKLIICVFTAFIFVMGLLYIFMPKNEFSETEKRYLATAPKLSFSSVKDGSFSKGFENFLADQTPMRTFFVSVNAYFELIKGNNGSNGAYLGKDGTLIEKPFDRDNRLDINIGRIAAFAKETGLRSSVVAVPSKGYVCSDKLPKNAMDYLDGQYSEKIKSALPGNIKYIDLTAEFKNSPDRDRYFYRTDHHWTSEGAFAAYKAISRDLFLPVSSVMHTIPSKDNYKIETVKGFYGTSYAKACYTLTKPDDVELWLDKETLGKAKVTIIDGKDEISSGSMFFRNHLSEGDKYLTFLDGNHPLVKIETGNEGANLLLIKDSFAHCIAPFLARDYAKIIMIDLRYYKSNVRQLIEEEDINEMMFLYSTENLATSRDILF